MAGNSRWAREARSTCAVALVTGEIIHTKDKITHFEDRLPKNLFVRIHRSFVLNKQYVMEIKAK